MKLRNLKEGQRFIAKFYNPKTDELVCFTTVRLCKITNSVAEIQPDYVRGRRFVDADILVEEI